MDKLLDHSPPSAACSPRKPFLELKTHRKALATQVESCCNTAHLHTLQMLPRVGFALMLRFDQPHVATALALASSNHEHEALVRWIESCRRKQADERNTCFILVACQVDLIFLNRAISVFNDERQSYYR